MNRNYKVIWNRSLGCFMAVTEYAKSRGKTSNSAVSSSGPASDNSAIGGVHLLQLSALCVGLASAGFSMQASAAIGASSIDTNECLVSGGVNTAANKSTGDIAVGCRSNASGSNAIVIGGNATTKVDSGTQGGQSVAIGFDAQAKGDQSVALGANVRASGNSSVAVGGDDVDKIANNTGQSAQYTAITGGTLTAGQYPNTEASGAGASAFGVQSVASGNFSSAIGMTSKASGAASVALGVNAKSSGEGALAIGAVSNASEKGSVALGINSKSSGLNSIAIGSGSTPATGANSSGANATSIGSASSAAEGATAIGAGAKATVNGGVAIGTEAVAKINSGIKGFDPSTGGATNQTSNVWQSTRGAVAFGDSANGITRQLTGLAAGTNDSDAVNVAQLKTVTNQTFKVQANDDTASAVKSSDTIKFVDGKNIQITRTDTGSGSNIIIKTKDNLALDSVTTGNSVLNNNGVTITDGSNITAVTSAGTEVTDGTNTSNYGADGFAIAGGPSVTSAGINAGNKKITNVDNGSVTLNSKDAINGGQLFDSADSVASVIGGNAVNNEGLITSTDIGGTGSNTIDGAITNIKDAATKAKTTVTEGENIVVTESTNLDGSTDYEVKTKRDLALDSVTTGNSVLNNNGVTITDGSNITAVTSAGTEVTDGTNTSNYGADGFAIAGGPSVTSAGINAGNKKITNVDNGSVTLNSKDAINGGQLFDSADSVASVIGGNAVNNEGLITSTDIGGTGSNTIDGAITNVKDAATKAKTTVTEGENIVVTESTNLDGSTDYEVKTKRDLALDSVTTGNSVLNNNGVTITDGSNITAVTSAGTEVTDGTNTSNYGADGFAIAGGPSVTSAGINAGNKKITNVDNGSVTLNSKDAINGGQLFDSADSVASVIGGNAVNNEGLITSTDIGGTGSNTIDGAITNVKDAATKAKTTVTEGENIVVTESTNLDGSTDYEVKTKRDLALDSVTTGNSVLNNNGVTITDGSNITAVTSAGTEVTDGTNTSNYGADGFAIAGGPSVTSAGINAGNKKITNVDNGSVTLNSKDAINGGQLFDSADSVASVIGGNAVNNEGLITSTDIGGTGSNTIDGAITNVKDAATKAKTTVTEGENIVVTESTNLDGSTDYEVKTKRDLALDSVTTGNSVLNNNGVTITDGSNITAVTSAGTEVTDGTNTSNYGADGFAIAGGPSVTSAGINAGNKKITNVDNGSVTLNSKDAINGGQLFDSADSVASVIGGNAVNNEGLITSTDIGGTGSNTIDGAITNIKDAATKAKTTVTEGENIVVTESTNLDGSTDYEVKTKRDLALDSVTTGNSVLNNNGVTITDGSNITAVTSAGTEVTDGTNTSNYGADGFAIAGGPSVTSAGINAGNKKITNVDNGSVTLNSKDAINGGQLFDSADSVASVIGGNAVNNEGLITSTDIGGTGSNTIDGAITNIKDAATKAKTTVTEGENIVVTESTNLDGSTDYEVKTKRDLALDSVTTGNSVLNNNGVTITDGSNITAVTSAGTEVTDGTNTSNYGADGFAIAGGPSVTSAGINAGNKKITNVDNGSVTLNSKDAINGGQLFDSADSVASVIGGNAVNNEGLITSTDIGGTGSNTIDGAITNVKDAATKAKTTVTEGENIVVTESTNLDGSTDYEVKTKRDLALDSVTTGNSVLNNDGVTITDGSNITAVTSAGTEVTDGTNTSNYGADGFAIAGGPSVTSAGINAGNKKITNVDNGSVTLNSKDAINGGQLFDSADSVASVIGGNAVNNEGLITSTDIGGTGSNTIDGAITNVKDAATKAKTTVTEGENIVVTESTNLDGSTDYEVKTKRDLALDSVTTGNSVLNNDGVTITDGSNITAVTSAGTEVTDGTNTSNYGADGFAIAGGPSVTSAGINAGNKKITNVDNGSVTLNSKDAINGGQLFDSADSVASVIGGNAVNNEGLITSTDIGGTGSNTIDGAITNVKDAATKAKTTVTEGENIVVTESTNLDGSTDYEVKTKRDLALDSVTTGNSVLNNDGVTITDGSNITAVTSAGTEVTDGTNTSNYGADGFTVTDATGNSSIFNQGGLSFTDTQGDVTGPSITASGIDAGGSTITNLKDGINAGDAVNKGQLDAITGNITAGGVQYDRNTDDTVNYDQVSFAGTPAIVGKDDNDNDIVVSGGTTLTNVANGINASDAVNKGQLDSVTKVKVFDKNGDEITVNLADQVVNNNVNNNDLESLFLTYNKEGQEVTDRLTIGETVQKMNTEGVKFAHTNASSQSKGDIANGVTNDSSAGGLDSTAIGVNAIIEAGADSTVALGHDTFASADATNSVVIGKGSEVTGESSIAIGDGAQALGNQSISIGTGNVVNGDNSGAFGDPSIIDGSNSYSVGNNNTINSNDTFVFGNNVTQTVEGSVVLGTGSAAMTGAGIAGFGAVSNAAIAATTSTTGAVAVGDAANNVYRQVTGVAAGTADSDAVNVSQLKAVSDALGDSNEALSNAAVQYDKNPDDTVNKGSITLGGAAGTTITNVKGGSIAAGSTDAINGGQLHNLGSDVAGIIGGDATYDANGNLTANNIGGTGKGNISDAIASINQGNAQANEDIQVNADNIQANTDRLDTGLSFGADTGDNINKPIGDSSALKFEGGNNITTSATGDGIKFDLNGNISVDSVTADSVTTGNTTVSNNGITIKEGPSMTTDGINAGDKTITGVADGIEVNDAVNLGQLNALDGKLSNSVNELGYKINEVEDDANAGISAAMAMSSLPQAYIPGKSMVGGGIATYNGQSAVAIGVSKVSDNGRWVIKVNGTADTQGNAGGAVGAGFHF
ncbi:YadA-like family protein [Psychrobacter sp. KFRI-CH2-11]|uniref:YadA-like family protein n=1 Tax=Psychrobacter sp. KFRI-CH2-11 TaxID=3156079 RepID=UPI00324BDF08